MAQLRIVTYNDSGSNTAAGSGLSTIFQGIAAEQRNGIKRPLDVISLQEQNVSLASTQNVVTVLNGIYGAGTYAASTVAGLGDTTQSVVYNTQTVSLIGQQAFLSIGAPGAARQPLRFQFRPVGYDAAADFYVYSAHTKASDDDVSAARRGVELAGVRANADAIGTGVRAIYTGDLNTYTASEAAITNITAPGGPGRAFDPVNRLGTWKNNSTFADVHTQSPVVTNSSYYGGQVGGGLDDRFDFQLLTAPMISGRGLSYISGTYHAFGNAALQFNKDVTDSGAAAALVQYFPGYTQAQVQAILQAIAESSDHLPVVADYRLPAKMTVTNVTAAPGRVIVGAGVNVSATIGNVVAVPVPQAGDQLDYTATLTGSATAAQSGTVFPTSAAQIKIFALNTATLGDRTASLDVSSSSPGVANGTSSTPYAYTVLAHATPSLASGTLTTSGTLDLGVVAIGRSLNAGVGVYNLADLSGFTATLNVTGGALSGDASVTVPTTTLANIDPGSSGNVGLVFAPTMFGAIGSLLNLTTFDETLPGATARDSLAVNIAGFGAYAGDADLTNTVDFDDLLVLARNFGTTGPVTFTQGDFNASGSVDFDDLLELARSFGFNGNPGGTSSRIDAASFADQWTLAQSLVPEPTTIGGLMMAALVGQRRRLAIRIARASSSV